MAKPFQFRLLTLFTLVALVGWGIVALPYWAYEFPREHGIRESKHEKPLSVDELLRRQGLPQNWARLLRRMGARRHASRLATVSRIFSSAWCTTKHAYPAKKASNTLGSHFPQAGSGAPAALLIFSRPMAG